MKPVILLSLAALALPAIVAAQGRSTPPAAKGNPTQVVILPIQGSSCPVAMRAKQGSGSGLVKVRKDRPGDGESMLSQKPGQQIHLILGRMPGADISDPGQIAGATVTVKGLSGRGRLDNALDLTGNDSSDLRRTVTVRFSTENDGTVSADLSLPGFTSVNSVRLESLDLKDGSTWSFAGMKACVVTPDRIMLVASE